ncbi:MAG TPA: 3'(2'),5'-bisphosphate nucleotidase CysQ [Saprospiraceae bacterium]|nr:3'(2'),5'-bisphosphate nucleotidase CysQ [Saprospiraceae bacterium]
MKYERIYKYFERLKPVFNEAGSMIMEIYNQSGYQTLIKDDHTPVTTADHQSNSLICKYLEEISPSIPVISEENADIPYIVRKDYEYFWLLDPLDGTKEFINKTGEFTINLALIKNDQPILGMVYVPVQKLLYWAIKQNGAFISNGMKEDISIRSSPFRWNDKRLRVICSRSHINTPTKKYMGQFEDPVIIPKGSALKFLLLSEGNADVYPRLGPTMEWDTAAPQIILEEAGGKIVELESGQPVTYNKESMLNPHFLATGILTQ